MVKTAFRTIAAVIAALVAGLLLVIGVELFSSVVHPIPSDFGNTPEAMCRHVENYPQWVLAAVVPMWGFAAFASTWIAQRIGNFVAAAIVGSLLLAAVAFNLSMLPYPAWFKIVNLLIFPAAIAAGSVLARRRFSGLEHSVTRDVHA